MRTLVEDGSIREQHDADSKAADVDLASPSRSRQRRFGSLSALPSQGSWMKPTTLFSPLFLAHKGPSLSLLLSPSSGHSSTHGRSSGDRARAQARRGNESTRSANGSSRRKTKGASRKSSSGSGSVRRGDGMQRSLVPRSVTDGGGSASRPVPRTVSGGSLWSATAGVRPVSASGRTSMNQTHASASSSREAEHDAEVQPAQGAGKIETETSQGTQHGISPRHRRAASGSVEAAAARAQESGRTLVSGNAGPRQQCHDSLEPAIRTHDTTDAAGPTESADSVLVPLEDNGISRDRAAAALYYAASTSESEDGTDSSPAGEEDLAFVPLGSLPPFFSREKRGRLASWDVRANGLHLARSQPRRGHQSQGQPSEPPGTLLGLRSLQVSQEKEEEGGENRSQSMGRSERRGPAELTGDTNHVLVEDEASAPDAAPSLYSVVVLREEVGRLRMELVKLRTENEDHVEELRKAREAKREVEGRLRRVEAEVQVAVDNARRKERLRLLKKQKAELQDQMQQITVAVAVASDAVHSAVVPTFE